MIGNLCDQAIEQVYLIKWPVSVYVYIYIYIYISGNKNICILVKYNPDSLALHCGMQKVYLKKQKQRH